ncbi:hypothetical protein [Actinomadura parmotrematis]|uniref:Transposase n=1 Tax=Actinomadura parmotrematis TaxID=2864039 RepID=A0ABS7FP24_9ACTN|nr:hypothetical protein [Actinomadura parmotrematis]MBW8481347.1 hypothetical protein [Actinomadura parmotrematis]
MARISLDPPRTPLYRLLAAVTDELTAALRGFLDERQLVELMFLVAVENLRSRFNAAAGLAGQGFRDRCEIPAGA